MIKRDKMGRFIKGTYPIKPFNGRERVGTKLKLWHIEILRKTWLGKKLSKEHRKKLSLAKVGYVPWIKGRNHTEESKLKISKAQKGKPKKRLNINELKTDESKLWRNRIEYRLWREAVFARDNWTCQICGQRGEELNPHHIKQFAYYPKLRFAIDNGITLCVKCHKDYHRKYGIKKGQKKLNQYPWCHRNYIK